MNDKNTNTPLISVLIPVYNVELYLDDCIKSAVEQSYQNIQVILVDDGSTDHSGKICDAWAERDGRICVVHQDNQGVADTRNKAIELAQGEYLAFLDSDDLYHKDYLKVMYNTMQEYDADIVQCSMERFVDEKLPPTDGELTQTPAEVLDARTMNARIYTSGDVEYTVVTNKIYKKKIFDAIRFPSGRIHEDTFTTFRLYYLADRVAVISAKIYYYRRRKSSIMTCEVSEKNINMLDAFEARMEYYAKIADKQLYCLCMERYLYSATVLYGRVYKSNKELACVFYSRAEEVYSKMKDNRERIKSHQMLKAYLFLKMPGIYSPVRKGVERGKRVLKKIGICKR